MTIEAKTVASFAESVQHEVKSLLFQEEKRAGKFILDSSELMLYFTGSESSKSFTHKPLPQDTLKTITLNGYGVENEY